VPDGNQVGDIPVWDGTAWVATQPAEPPEPPPTQRIIELPPESNARVADELAIDAEDRGTRRVAIGELSEFFGLPDGINPGDILVWNGSQWVPQAPVPVATLLSLTLASGSVLGGSSVTGTVTLTSAAPGGGAVVSIESSNPAVAAVPVQITIAAGQSAGTFSVTTTVVPSSTAVQINATYGANTRTANLTVTAAAAAKTIYWGRSTAEHLTTEAEITGLVSDRQDTDYKGTAGFADATPSDYAFIAWPQSFGGPVPPNGLSVAGFPASMADGSVGYGTTSVNGYMAEVVTVAGEPYLVFRLYYQTGGSFDLVAN
jgi:hypothetical protein